jgi:hypothetical protein
MARRAYRRTWRDHTHHWAGDPRRTTRGADRRAAIRAHGQSWVAEASDVTVTAADGSQRTESATPAGARGRPREARRAHRHPGQADAQH